jgi:uncharacterized protein YdaU (DUF1376 family)
MANNLYIPFHPGDYLADTAHLSAAEHGAYFLLILNYWQRGEPLPCDDRKLRGIARMSADEWAQARETVLEFFEERDGLLYHKRVDEELANARQKSDSARANAKRSHSNRRANAEQPQSERIAPAQQTQSERSANQDQDQDQDQEEDEAIASSSADDAKIQLSEMVRRLEQATGWRDLPGASVIEALVLEGFSFEGRILPLARDEAARRDDAPRGWAYLAAVVRDLTRSPAPSAKPVEMAWVPQDSPAWKALVLGGRKESYLRQIAKPGPGGDGIYWPVSDMPKVSPSARKATGLPPLADEAAA